MEFHIANGEIINVTGRGKILACDIGNNDINKGDTIIYNGIKYQVTGVECMRLNGKISSKQGLIIKDL